VLAHDIGSCFDHILVDEYQDTNRLQLSIVLVLKPDYCRPQSRLRADTGTVFSVEASHAIGSRFQL
jgi:superfamily I DNA/RNA helicase